MNIDPDNLGNNEEMHWAIKAFQHAEIYFDQLVSTECKKIRLTPMDQEIYTLFRKEFPDLKLHSIDEMEDFKSPNAKLKWRNFISQFENEVEDYNFGTLLRNKCDQDYGPENAFFVPRIQFLCVEIARNFEGLNAAVYKNQDIVANREVVDNKELDEELAKLQSKIEGQLDKN